jgi:hypothetical protein
VLSIQSNTWWIKAIEKRIEKEMLLYNTIIADESKEVILEYIHHPSKCKRTLTVRSVFYHWA